MDTEDYTTLLDFAGVDGFAIDLLALNHES